jgi:hypothetical protein
MTTNDIVAIIDVASDKLAGFVQAATPLAQEIVRQYQMRAAFAAVAWLAGGAMLASIARWCWKKSHDISITKEYRDVLVMCAIVITICACLTVVGAPVQTCNAIAPLCGLIGK